MLKEIVLNHTDLTLYTGDVELDVDGFKKLYVYTDWDNPGDYDYQINGRWGFRDPDTEDLIVHRFDNAFYTEERELIDVDVKSPILRVYIYCTVDEGETPPRPSIYAYAQSY